MLSQRDIIQIIIDCIIVCMIKINWFSMCMPNTIDINWLCNNPKLTWLYEMHCIVYATAILTVCQYVTLVIVLKQLCIS